MITLHIRKNLFGIYKKYWDELFNHTDWYEIFGSRLFQSDAMPNDFIYKSLSYLKDENYYKLGKNIENTELNFYEGDIFTLVSSLTSKYDLVYLSNIIDYANKKDYKNLLSKFNLNDNGVVLSYIFSHVKKYSDFLDMCEVKEDSKEDRGVLIYK